MFKPAQSGYFLYLVQEVTGLHTLPTEQSKANENKFPCIVFWTFLFEPIFTFTLCFIYVNRAFYISRSTRCYLWRVYICFPYVPLFGKGNDKLKFVWTELKLCISANCDGKTGNCCLLSGFWQTLKHSLSIHLVVKHLRTTVGIVIFNCDKYLQLQSKLFSFV